MQFIPLPNFKQMMKLSTLKTNLTFTNISGNSQTLKNPWTYTNYTTLAIFTNCSPFFTDKASNYTAVTETRLFVRAASDTVIQNYSPLNQIGSCTITTVENSGSNGWTMTIKVSGTEGSKINTLYFSRKLWYGGNGGESSEAVLFAVKLDNEVTIGATGEADFTFSIRFD